MDQHDVIVYRCVCNCAYNCLQFGYVKVHVTKPQIPYERLDQYFSTQFSVVPTYSGTDVPYACVFCTGV